MDPSLGVEVSLRSLHALVELSSYSKSSRLELGSSMIGASIPKGERV